jgi:hypothetical protein
VNEPSASPVPYRVVYSEHVRSALKDLLTRAKACGQGRPALDAVKEIDRRLHLFPQFGEPRRDLPALGVTIWAGTVPPLLVEYLIDERQRLVSVAIPFKALPNSGF